MGRKSKRSFLKSVTPGERSWLRDDALKQIQTRGWNVKVDNIDWEAYRKADG
jgi:hypothetical protein